MTADADPVAAYLAAARQRWDTAENAVYATLLGRAQALTSLADVPRLLAAVEAVLARHVRQEQPVRSYDLDLRCPAHHWTTAAASVADIRNCPDCTYREHRVCANPDCREHGWPCPDYQAIATELLRGNDA